MLLLVLYLAKQVTQPVLLKIILYYVINKNQSLYLEWEKTNPRIYYGYIIQSPKAYQTTLNNHFLLEFFVCLMLQKMLARYIFSLFNFPGELREASPKNTIE